MTENLLDNTWENIDSTELRLFLKERIAGLGQYDGKSSKKLYLPLADDSCQIVLTYKDRRIFRIERGPAFDEVEWKRLRMEIENSILAGPLKMGRDFSFSSYRVLGSWRGSSSGVQILQPPDDAPKSKFEVAEHPFILEYPLQVCELWSITSHRRLREHRKLTFLLNILLAGRTSLQSRRSDHFWASVDRDDGTSEIKWVKQDYFANLGPAVVDQISSFVGEPIEEIEPDIYYEKSGIDGKGLRVPADLDDSICRYFQLSPINRVKFDRAAFWLDMASRQWNISVSSSFASLVSAVESLTDSGTTHRVYCDECNSPSQHEVPGATERFRAFFEQYAPDTSQRSRRSEMYSLRSGILHGSELMQLDQDLALGWDPPEWNERKLHDELWGLTRTAIRNWLKNPPGN
jgi:hypothetical protein